MNILHVLDRSVPNLSGYSSRSRYIVENQEQMGLKPFVVTCERQMSDKKVEIFNNIKYIRTQPNFLKRFKIIPFLRELIEINNLRNNISAILTEYNIDLIHAHSPCILGVAALLAARKMDIPIVYEIRAFWEDAAVDANKYQINSIKYKLVRGLETWLVHRVNHIFTISHGLMKDMVDRGIENAKITVIPNGVDLRKFYPVPIDSKIIDKYGLKDSFILGFIGSFFNFEGLDLLIDALFKIRKMEPKVKLMLVGSGEMESFLKDKVKKLELESDVIFTGKVPHEEILNYYSVMDVMIYPRKSKRITELVTPLKPLEAMAMKKCVVLSDVGGHKELVSDHNAVIFFKKESIDDLTNKLLLYISSQSKVNQIQENAYVYIKKEKSWENIVKYYLPVYHDIITK